MPQVVTGLRKIARKRMAGEMPAHTVQPTALINEVYIRLVGSTRLSAIGALPWLGLEGI